MLTHIQLAIHSTDRGEPFLPPIATFNKLLTSIDRDWPVSMGHPTPVCGTCKGIIYRHPSYHISPENISRIAETVQKYFRDKLKRKVKFRVKVMHWKPECTDPGGVYMVNLNAQGILPGVTTLPPPLPNTETTGA